MMPLLRCRLRVAMLIRQYALMLPLAAALDGCIFYATIVFAMLTLVDYFSLIYTLIRR